MKTSLSAISLTGICLLLSSTYLSAAPAPCVNGTCEVTVGNSSIFVSPDQPGIADDGSRFKTKYIDSPTTPSFHIPLNGGLTQWTVDGQNRMFSESFWYRLGPANPANPAANPEIYWSDVFNGLTGTTDVLANGVGHITATPAPTTGINIQAEYFLRDHPQLKDVDSSLSELITITNTNPSPVNLSFFIYTDLDLSPSGDIAEAVFDNQGNLTQIRQWAGNRNALRVDANIHPSAGVQPSFGLGYIAGKVYPDGQPSILDLLNNNDLLANFTNQTSPLNDPGGDIVYVLQYDFGMINGTDPNAANYDPNSSNRRIISFGFYDVPEPPIGMLFGLGLAALIVFRRNRLTG